MTSLDSLILDDLRTLGTDAEALPDEGVFRDGSAGAAARRDELAAASARELAASLRAPTSMYAARVGRTIAAAVTALLAEAVVLAFGVADLVPRRANLLLLFTGLGLVAAYLVIAACTRALVRRSFARRLRAIATPHGDVYTQIDQLSRSPWLFARRCIDGVDGTTAILTAGALAVVFEIVFVLLGFALADHPAATGIRAALFGCAAFALAPAALAMLVVRWSLTAARPLVAKVRTVLLLPGILVLFVTSSIDNSFPFIPSGCGVFAIITSIALGLRAYEQRKLDGYDRKRAAQLARGDTRPDPAELLIL